jgi:tRNA dimethylallyltransferase
MRLTYHILLGPTASGKTAVAAHLAARLDAQVISADSMKVYRGMDIGTAKPDAELRARFGYHLLDLRHPAGHYDARQFVADADAAAAAIARSGHAVLFEGGTPLYLKCLLDGMFEGPGADADLRARLEEDYRRDGAAATHARLAAVDPATAARLHPNDRKRVLRALEVHALTGRPISQLQQQFGRRRRDVDVKPAGIRWEPEALKARIARRTQAMLDAGWLDEVARLQADPAGLGRTASQAIGYRELAEVVRGERSVEEAAEAITRNTWRLARRQMMWFRRFEDVVWFDATEPFDAAGAADAVAAAWQARGDASGPGKS